MSALDDIAAERRRQIEVEGWTPEHDDEHGSGALAAAAASYAYKASLTLRNDFRFGTGYPPPIWPGWATKWWKPKDHRADLIRAGALIVAEIERLDRAALHKPEGSDPEPADDGKGGWSSAKGIELIVCMERFEDCLRTVCHHLQLPQSESGPCDDPSQYERALEGLIESLELAEAESKLASERRFRAEAALQPFADAAKGLSDAWSGARGAASLNWDGLKVDHFRKAVQALAVNSKPAPWWPQRPEETAV